MRRVVLFILASTMFAPLAAAPRKAPPRPAEKPAAEETLIQSCDAHKFETIVDATGADGQPKKSKVKLCGIEGQSNAEWIGTLKDAIRKLEANKDMPGAERDQIVSAIRAEIARLSIVGAPVPAPKPEETGQASSPLSRDYAALPPMPPPLAAPPPVAPPPAVPVQPSAAEPTPPPVPVGVPVPAPSTAVALPKLSFQCYTPGDIGGEGPCAELEHETLLTVQAKGNVPIGAALHFIRNGEDRAEVDLAPLSRGGSMRIVLPREVCSGFGAGRLELQVIVNGSTARSEGPFPLRCN